MFGSKLADDLFGNSIPENYTNIGERLILSDGSYWIRDSVFDGFVSELSGGTIT